MGAIKIAVDAGHGSNTPGKRTPPMPKNIDFEADGVIDVKRAKQFANTRRMLELLIIRLII